MIETVLFDLDGVIRIYREHATREVERAFSLSFGSIDQAAFTPHLLRQVTTGTMTRRQWVAAVGEAIGCPDAAEMWEKRPVETDHSVLAMVSAITAQGVPACLITNGTDNLHAELQSLGLSHLFSRIFNSAELGVAKPSAQIFRLVIGALRIRPDRIAYVDDTEANIVSAKTLGISAMHYTGATQLRTWLSELGLAMPDV